MLLLPLVELVAIWTAAELPLNPLADDFVSEIGTGEGFEVGEINPLSASAEPSTTKTFFKFHLGFPSGSVRVGHH